MDVLPFSMGPVDAEIPIFGVQITDSADVAASMRVMIRMGACVLAAMTIDGETDLVPGSADAHDGPTPCFMTDRRSAVAGLRDVSSRAGARV